MKITVQNVKPYAIDTPVALAPGESAEVERTPDVDSQIEAGVLEDITPAKKKEGSK